MAYQSLDQMLGTNLNGQLVLRLDANVDYYWLADAFQLAVYVQLMVLLDYFFAVVVEETYFSLIDLWYCLLVPFLKHDHEKYVSSTTTAKK
jgi:hypothetical protein